MNKNDESTQDALRNELEDELEDEFENEPADDSPKKAFPAPRYSLPRIIIYSILLFIPFITGVALTVLSIWYDDAFGLEFKALLYALNTPLEGAGGETFRQIFTACLPWVFAALVLYVGVTVIIARKTAIFRLLRRIGAGLCALVLVGSLVIAMFAFRVPQYLETIGQKTLIYEEYYIDPADAVITADGKTKNLIFLCMESMETDYASVDVGGVESVNYIDGLTELAMEGVSFSDKDSGMLGGFRTFEGATSWTMAALFALTSGLPYSFPVGQNDMSEEKYFAPGVTTIGDILEGFGYNQEFLCGSDAAFGGRKKYFTQHGNYDIYDLFAARKNGDVSPNYDNKFWGFEDKYLYEIAKKELTRLAAEDEPFNLTLLTVDTHFEKGYICSECDNTYKTQMKNVLTCADRQAVEFIRWCQEQDFYEDTVIVISGDHPIMGTKYGLGNGSSTNDRPVYNCILNAAVQPVEGTVNNRLFTSMDMFPTTLAAMGFKIEGNQLALGVNMFSGEKTLIERIGYDEFKAEVLKGSDYYNEFTGFNKNRETAEP